MVAALALAEGGFFPAAWVWSAVVLCWLGAVAVIMRARLAVARAQWFWLGAFALLTGWTAASALWSADPGQSLLEGRRTLVYLAAAAAIVLTVRTADVEAVLAGVWAAVLLVSSYGLARYLLGPPRERVADVAEGALLFRPIGYANGLAAFVVIGTVLGVGIALHGRRSELRVAAAASLVPCAAVLRLTESRGGALALAAGIAFAVVADRQRSLLVRLLPAAVAAAAIAWLAGRSALTSPATTLAPRIGGSVLAAATVAFALCAAAGTLLLERRSGARVPRRLGVGVAALLAAALAFAIYEAAPRLSGASHRGQYAAVAWHEYTSHPFLGSGAGTFGRYWERNGPADAGGARDAHNLYLETLAEVGPLGLALLCIAFTVPLTQLRLAARQPLAAEAASAYVAFLVHAALDWDWELPAVSVAALLCAGSLLVSARRSDALVEVRRRGRGVVAAALIVLAAVALAGLGSGSLPK
ncbi:MAG: O-antigen ligase family protein [Gaiellaceae bacterium]